MAWDIDEAVDELDEFSGQLHQILREGLELDSSLDRLERWHVRIQSWFVETLGAAEAARFVAKCALPQSFTTGQHAMEAFQGLLRYLDGLRSDMRTDPNYWEGVMSAAIADDDDDEREAEGSGWASTSLDRICLGHGRSSTWKVVHDYLVDELGLAVDAFESQSRSGFHIVDVLETLLAAAGFGIVVLTAEDLTAEGNLRPRQNVVHETGLFQGRLGFRRVAVMLEEGVEEFSNIAGLQQIRFKKGRIEGALPELRRMLKREGLV